MHTNRHGCTGNTEGRAALQRQTVKQVQRADNKLPATKMNVLNKSPMANQHRGKFIWFDVKHTCQALVIHFMNY